MNFFVLFFALPMMRTEGRDYVNQQKTVTDIIMCSKYCAKWIGRNAKTIASFGNSTMRETEPTTAGGNHVSKKKMN
jgi:hypothetical protein